MGLPFQALSEENLSGAQSGFEELGKKGAAQTRLGRGFQAENAQTFRPLRRRLAASAEVDTGALVDEAATGVGLSFDKAKGIQDRNLSRMGVNPNAGRFAGLQQKWALARAAAEAGSKTRARRQGREENLSRMLRVVGVGENLPQLGLNATAQGASNQAVSARGLQSVAGDFGDLSADEAFQGEIDSLFPEAQQLPPVDTSFSDQLRADSREQKREVEERIARGRFI